MNDMISLDILLVTYNQEQYIQQALDGILMQRINPDVQVRIIVADDCSKDNTLAYIRRTLGAKAKLASGNEAEVVYLSAEHNLGIAGNYKRAIAATTGDYVAVLEGDDYWTDAYRLQKHVNYLSTHTDCVMTKNNYFTCDQSSKEWQLNTSPRQYLLLRNNIYEYILGNLSCTVIRGDVLRKVNPRVYEFGEMQRHEATDYYLTIGVLQSGYGYVLEGAMSVYRINTGTNFSLRTMTGEDYIAKSCLCYELTCELLGKEYKDSCKKVYSDTVKWVAEYSRAEKEKAWAEYCPPFFAHLVWNWIPKCWLGIKSAMRACVPNALHRKIKKK